MVADASSQLKIRFAWAGCRQKIVTTTSFPRCAMTSTNYELTTDDLEAHFSEQLGFLDRSAASFDAGFESEAKRLAHTIRILVHDTGTSHSLLGQLNLKDREWLDTCIPDESGNLMTHGGLVAQAIGRKVRWVAMLDEVPIVSKKSFDEWWDAPVFRDDARSTLSRRQLVLTMANKDGGSHVDPTLTTDYARLVKDNSLGFTWVEEGIERPASGPEKAAIRQIAHEVLSSLKLGYQKKRAPGSDDGVIVMGGAMVKGVPDWATPQPLGPADLPEDPTRVARALTGRKLGKRQKRRAIQRTKR